MSWRDRLALRLLSKSKREEIEKSAIYEMVVGKTAKRRTATELIQSYKTSPMFRSVVSKIADDIAAVRWRAYVVRGSGGKAKRTRIGRIRDRKQRRRELFRARRKGELEELEDHRVLNLLDEANREMTAFDAMRVTQVWLDVVGEAFWTLDIDGLGVPGAYWPTPPHWVTETPTSGSNTFLLRVHGKEMRIPAEQMVYFREVDPVNPYGRGSGVGEALGDEIDTAEYAAKYVKNFFLNSGKPDLLVSVEGPSGGRVDKEALKQAKAQFEAQHRGYGRAHRSWWHSGKVNVTELNSSFQDMQVVELQGVQREKFVQTYGVSPEVLGILSNSNRATITQALRLYATNVLVPRLERLRATKQARLVPMYDERVIYDYESPVPDDDDFELEAVKAAPWAPTRGEIRMLQGFEDRGDVDDVHMTPINIIAQRPAAPVYDFPPPPADGKHKKAVTKNPAVDNTLAHLLPERLTTELDPVWVEEVREWGDDVLDELGVGVSFNMLNPLVVGHLEEFAGKRIKGLVNETTRKALAASLTEGVRAGEGAAELARRVSTTFDEARGWRAMNIARTECARSANFASVSAYRQSGVVEKKEWVAIIDGATRDSHVAADGQIVPLNEPFIVNGYPADYPGTVGVGAEDINCRCSVAAVVQDRSHDYDQRRALWRVFDSKVTAWEKLAIQALKRGFDAQESDVLAAVSQYFG